MADEQGAQRHVGRQTHGGAVHAVAGGGHAGLHVHGGLVPDHCARLQ